MRFEKGDILFNLRVKGLEKYHNPLFHVNWVVDTNERSEFGCSNADGGHVESLDTSDFILYRKRVLFKKRSKVSIVCDRLYFVLHYKYVERTPIKRRRKKK